MGKKTEAEMTPFELCRKKPKMSIKEMVEWLSIPSSFLNYYSIKIGDKMMLLNENVVSISHDLKSFDRWANSTDQTLDLNNRSDRKEFVDLLEDAHLQGLVIEET